MVSLQLYPARFLGPATGQLALQLAGKLSEVDALVVDSLDDGDIATPFAFFNKNPDSLLFLYDGFADTKVLRQPALRTYLTQVFKSPILDADNPMDQRCIYFFVPPLLKRP
jgi:hypothetical protein